MLLRQDKKEYKKVYKRILNVLIKTNIQRNRNGIRDKKKLKSMKRSQY